MREGYTKSAGPGTPLVFGELEDVFIKLRSTSIVASDSSPDTTGSHAGSGVYSGTFPKAVRGWVLGCHQVGQAASVNANVTALDVAAGTYSVTLSDAGALGASEEIHLLIRTSRKDASVAG